MGEDQKAGTTPETDADDAKKALSENVNEAGRDAGDDADDELTTLRKEKGLFLANKGVVEERNRLKAEKEELEARLREREESPTATAPGAASDPRMAELEADLAAVEANYRAGVPGSLTTMRLLQDQLQLRREMADDSYLSRLRDPVEEKELATFYKANKAHFNSIQAAHDAMLGRKARQSQAELARERAALAAKEAEVAADAARKEAGTVSTHERGITAGEVRQRKMSEAAFNEKIAKYEAEGREGEAFNLRRDRRNGKLIVG